MGAVQFNSYIYLIIISQKTLSLKQKKNYNRLKKENKIQKKLNSTK